MQTNNSSFARRYDREFKQNAVALVQSGRSVTEVARDLGVSHWSLNRWVKDTLSGQNLSEPKTLSTETPEPFHHVLRIVHASAQQEKLRARGRHRERQFIIQSAIWITDHLVLVHHEQ